MCPFKHMVASKKLSGALLASLFGSNTSKPDKLAVIKHDQVHDAVALQAYRAYIWLLLANL